MKNDSWRAAALLASLLLAAAPLPAAEPDEGSAAMTAEMAKWMELASPGEHHAALADFEGTWDVTSKVWMDPTQPPSEGKGTSVHKLLLGGRFLESRMDAEFMGGPFQGFGISGFDNLRQKHVSFWIDTMGTLMTFSEGTCDGHCAVITEIGQMPDPMTGEAKSYRMVTRRLNKDRVVLEMYNEGPGGGEMKTMEMAYTRAKH